MYAMLAQKYMRLYAAVIGFCALTAGSTCGNAQTYVPLPDEIRDALADLGVKDLFSIYAVDINGDLVLLVPSDVTVEPVKFPLASQMVENASGFTVIRLEASTSTMTCRWPPIAGDPPCSKQTKN